MKNVIQKPSVLLCQEGKEKEKAGFEPATFEQKLDSASFQEPKTLNIKTAWNQERVNWPFSILLSYFLGNYVFKKTSKLCPKLRPLEQLFQKVDAIKNFKQTPGTK